MCSGDAGDDSDIEFGFRVPFDVGREGNGLSPPKGIFIILKHGTACNRAKNQGSIWRRDEERLN